MIVKKLTEKNGRLMLNSIQLNYFFDLLHGMTLQVKWFHFPFLKKLYVSSHPIIIFKCQIRQGRNSRWQIGVLINDSFTHWYIKESSNLIIIIIYIVFFIDTVSCVISAISCVRAFVDFLFFFLYPPREKRILQFKNDVI